MVTATPFTPPDMANFYDPSWVASGNATSVLATGNSVSYLDWTFTFADPQTSPTIFDYWAHTGPGTIWWKTEISWNASSGWSYNSDQQPTLTSPVPENTLVPEPPIIILLGLGFGGIWFFNPAASRKA
jgi:hypothetical protein